MCVGVATPAPVSDTVEGDEAGDGAEPSSVGVDAAVAGGVGAAAESDDALEEVGTVVDSADRASEGDADGDVPSLASFRCAAWSTLVAIPEATEEPSGVAATAVALSGAVPAPGAEFDAFPEAVKPSALDIR